MKMDLPEINENETLETVVKRMDQEKVKREQKQELFESIRHFLKYLAYENMSKEFACPDMAENVKEAMCSLFEEHYEKEASHDIQ